jgi:hypothetical protein
MARILKNVEVTPNKNIKYQQQIKIKEQNAKK